MGMRIDHHRLITVTSTTKDTNNQARQQMAALNINTLSQQGAFPVVNDLGDAEVWVTATASVVLAPIAAAPVPAQ